MTKNNDDSTKASSGLQFVLDRLQAKALTTEIVKLVVMASDMHAIGKTPQAMFSSLYQDVKHAIDVAKEVCAKMSSLIVD